MSIWGKFETFFEKVGAEIKKIFGSTTVNQTIKATLTVVGPLVVTVVGLAGGPAASAAAAAILTDIQTDFGTVSALVQDGIPAAGSSAAQALTTALGSLKSNLGNLLTDAGVKSSASFSTIETNINLVINEVVAIEQALTSSAA
jgi:hypothetical protein